MPEELLNTTDVETIFSDISTMIYDAKNEVMLRVNTSVITFVILEYRKETVRRGITREKTRLW